MSFFDDLCRRIYGAGFFRYEEIEKELEDLKREEVLEYKHLLIIEECWPLFPNWYRWPCETEIKTELEDAQISFAVLNNFEENVNNEIDKQLFKQLHKILKHPELVSVVLRFVGPDHYGICSPPATYALDSPRGIDYVNDYINHINRLRVFQKVFGHDKASYTDMLIWALTKGKQKNIQLEVDEDLNLIQEQIDREKLSDLYNKLKLDQLAEKPLLELAETFKRHKGYMIAAPFAGKAFELAVVKKCEEKGIPTIDPETKRDKELAILIQQLTKLLRKTDKLLVEVKNLRNDAAHATDYRFTKRDLCKMIETTKDIETW